MFYGNLINEKHSELQVQFPKELSIVVEIGNNNANVDKKDIYAESASQ